MQAQAEVAVTEGAPRLEQKAPVMAERKHREVDKRSLTWSQICKSLAAGGVAGAVSRTSVAPLERLKILMQIQGNEKQYTGVVQGTLQMFRNDGVRGMFKGNGLNCIRIIPNQAIKFLTYEQLSRKISHYLIDQGGDGQLTPVMRLLAGAGAGIIGMSATYPMDMVRGRITIQETGHQQYRGLLHATGCIVREEGLLALWRGWLPSVIGVVPYVGLNFGVYETLKDVIIKMYGLRDERDLSIAVRLGCGALAGTLGQTLAYPFDVVRRRLQVSGWSGAKALHADHGQAVAYRGMVDCFVRTVREEGVQALFKGLAPNYVKVVPSIAIAFVTYEQVKEILGAEIRLSD
jgi:solute carrier family 25 phosphate transporter 23/24/25/41